MNGVKQQARLSAFLVVFLAFMTRVSLERLTVHNWKNLWMRKHSKWWYAWASATNKESKDVKQELASLELHFANHCAFCESLRYVGAGCSGLFSVFAPQYHDIITPHVTISIDRSGKATVCGLGRSKCEPGSVPKSADCGLPAWNVGDVNFCNQKIAFERTVYVEMFAEVNGPDQLLYNQKRLAAW